MTEYKDQIVLYVSESCLHCSLVKVRLKNYLDRITVHVVEEDGYPQPMVALPELAAYEGLVKVNNVIGSRSDTSYIDFFEKYGYLLDENEHT